MEMARTSKLLATKRPNLAPVADSVCSGALPVENQWRALSTAFRPQEVRDQIIKVTAAEPEHVTLLRRIDVMLWMGHRRGAPPCPVCNRYVQAQRLYGATDDVAGPTTTIEGAFDDTD